MKTIDTLGPDFVKRHEWLLGITRFSGVAICGSCATAIAKGNTSYVPPDLDLVSTQEGALQFLGMVNRFLISRPNHYRVYSNSHNDFVPSPAIAHYRITSSFWVPVCLFVLPPELFRYYRIQGGYMVQLIGDVKQAADELTAKDDKPRLANEEAEWWEEPEDRELPDESPMEFLQEPPSEIFSRAKALDVPDPADFDYRKQLS